MIIKLLISVFLPIISVMWRRVGRVRLIVERRTDVRRGRTSAAILLHAANTIELNVIEKVKDCEF